WAGYVAARPMKTRDQAVSNRIGARRHDDWDSLRDSFRRPDCRCAFGHDDIQPQSNQLGCDLRKRVLLALGKAVLDANVLPLDPAVFLQCLTKCLNLPPPPRGARAARQEKANRPRSSRLLRARRERPRRRAADESDELAAFHVRRHRDFLPYSLSAPPCARLFARPT